MNNKYVRVDRQNICMGEMKGIKPGVGVASSGRGPLISTNNVNKYLEAIQNFKYIIWNAK